MSSVAFQTEAISTPHSSVEQLELARKLFQEFRPICSWHSPRDLVITEDLIGFVAKGLQAHGGHLGFMLSGKLRPNTLGQETRECR
jgi:hypothetical protein